MNCKNLFLLMCLCGFATVKAQFAQTAKIVSTNRESRAEYGTSVALTENLAVVGASRETIASGAAYIYAKDSQGEWSFLQRLAATDPNEGAEYGGGVAFAGGYVVVAAGRADVAGLQRAGALYVYENINGNWELDTKLLASDMSGEAKLGMNPTSLSADGNTVVGGAPGENSWTGSVYVFNNVAGTWTESQKILSPNPQPNDVFGIGVSISGDYLAVGASEVDARKGAVYIYLKNSNGDFEYVQTLVASDAGNNDFFGTSVSLAGNQLVVGAYGKNAEQGAAYIFERNNQGTWEEVQKVNGNASSEGTQFGWSTSIQQDYIVVSAPHIFGAEAGEVYLYKRNNSGTWAEEQIVQGTDTVGEDFYGWSIALWGDELIAGAPWEDHDANGGNEIDRAGSAYIFQDPDLLGVIVDYDSMDSLKLFPNPSKNIVNLRSSMLVESLQLYGTNGSRLGEKLSVNANQYTLDISNLAAGIYFVNVIFEDGSTKVQKLIKQ